MKQSHCSNPNVFFSGLCVEHCMSFLFLNLHLHKVQSTERRKKCLEYFFSKIVLFNDKVNMKMLSLSLSKLNFEINERKEEILSVVSCLCDGRHLEPAMHYRRTESGTELYSPTYFTKYDKWNERYYFYHNNKSIV